MRHEVFSLDFRREGAISYPANPELHRLVVQYAAKNLAAMPPLADFMKVWVACETDDSGTPIAVEGLLWSAQVIDFPGFRYRTPWAAKALIDRARSFLDDNGARGSDVFVHVSSTEGPEQKCEQWQDWINYTGAVPADRYRIRVW